MFVDIIDVLKSSVLVGYNLWIVSFCFLYFCWRLWKFTVNPFLRPNDPKELPYWVPFFGHTLAFFGNSDRLLERGLNYTNRTHEIYTIQVFRKKLYIITAPLDVAAAFKNNTSLHFDGHLNELLRNFGFGGEALRLAWHVPQPGEWCYIPNSSINPEQMSLNRLTEDVYKKQLLPGEKMDVMCKVFLAALHQTLRWQDLDFCTINKPGNNGPRKLVSLRALCRHTMVDAATRSMFGGHLHEIEPKIVEHMLTFNDFAWMVFFQYPDLFGSPVSEARRKITDALKTFIMLPEEQRSEQAWSIKTIIAAQGVVGIDLQARASVILMIYWAANSNEYNISFWIIAHLLHNETLLNLVQQETEDSWKNGELDIKHLCANAPNFDAIFCESLRLNGGAMVSRIVMSPITIGGKILLPGNAVIIPSRQLHKNEQVWGNTADDFDAYRFTRTKGLARHASYRPFGGGVTYCPGRVLAKEEVFGFIAILLHNFDIKLANGKQEFPKLDDSTPALGITGPVKSMDVMVNIEAKR